METTPEDLNGPEQGADISQGVQDSTSIALEDGDIQDVSWGGIGHANGPTRRRMLLDLLALDDTEVLRTLVEPQDRVARDPGNLGFCSLMPFGCLKCLSDYLRKKITSIIVYTFNRCFSWSENVYMQLFISQGGRSTGTKIMT